MTFQHLLKILVFGLVGFAFLEWVFVLLCMIVLGYLGTKVGLALLGRSPEARFRTVYQWFLTLLAVRLLLGYV
jgi:hypothetical protein